MSGKATLKDRAKNKIRRLKDKWIENYATPRKYSQLGAIAAIFSGAMGLFGLLLSFRLATAGLTKDIENSTDKIDGQGYTGWNGWFYASIAFALVQTLQLVFDVTFVAYWERQLHLMFSDPQEKPNACTRYKNKVKGWFIVFVVVHLGSLVPHLGNLSGAIILLMGTAKDAAVGFSAGNVFFSSFIVLGTLFIAFKYANAIFYFEQACRTKATSLRDQVGQHDGGSAASAHATLAPYVVGKMH